MKVSRSPEPSSGSSEQNILIIFSVANYCSLTWPATLTTIVHLPKIGEGFIFLVRHTLYVSKANITVTDNAHVALDGDCEPLKMRLFSIAAATLVAVLCAANPVISTESDLSKRDCVYNGCVCQSGAAGLYCGGCAGVVYWGENLDSDPYSDVYQCDPNNPNNCCDYGYRISCDSSNPGPCGG